MSIDTDRGLTSSLRRRDFLTAAVVIPLGLLVERRAAAAEEVTAPSRIVGDERDWSKIRGFNYRPSYGTSGLELWGNFDERAIETEIARGKRYFPHINAIRWWQSWDAFQRDPKRYAQSFEASLRLTEKYGCALMPVLFNRCHGNLDFGGVYIDHFLPGSLSYLADSTEPFLTALLGAHRGDPRVLAWDLCNEPYWYNSSLDPRDHQVPQSVVDAETAWLEDLHNRCKALDPKTPCTVGAHARIPLERMDRFSDVLSAHPYWASEHPEYFGTERECNERLEAHAKFARKVGKPLVATECCWGNPNDTVRVKTIRHDLTHLHRHGIGWMAWVLNESPVRDPRTEDGSFAFIDADGSLRRGHEVFNEF